MISWSRHLEMHLLVCIVILQNAAFPCRFSEKPVYVVFMTVSVVAAATLLSFLSQYFALLISSSGQLGFCWMVPLTADQQDESFHVCVMGSCPTLYYRNLHTSVWLFGYVVIYHTRLEASLG